LGKAHPVESYIAPTDFELGGYEVPKGTWMLAVHFPDTDLWGLVKSGERKAFSIKGHGKRTKVET